MNKDIPPFKVLGVQQIALAALEKKSFHRLWIDLLGLTFTRHYSSSTENVMEDICRMGTGPLSVEIDLMQPLDQDKKPAVHTVPLNHIGLWVDDLSKAVDWLTARGVRFTSGGIRKGAARHDICFIHPKSSADFPVSGEGVLIELVQAPKEVCKAFMCLADYSFI